MSRRRLLPGALLLLLGCASQKSNVTESHSVSDVAIEDKHEAEASGHVASGSVVTIVNEFAADPSDPGGPPAGPPSAAVLPPDQPLPGVDNPSLAPGRKRAPGRGQARAGLLRQTISYTLPIGADPRLPPVAGPAAPAFTQDASARAAGATETKAQAVADGKADQERATRLGPPPWVWVAIPVALLVAAAVLWKLKIIP